MSSKISFFVFLLFLATSCKKKVVNDIGLTMTNDELVEALINLSTVNGANNLNDPASKDSLSKIYLKKIESLGGQNMKEIRRNLDILTKHPDTLLMIQNRALDTLRAMQERQMRAVKTNIENK